MPFLLGSKKAPNRLGYCWHLGIILGPESSRLIIGIPKPLLFLREIVSNSIIERIEKVGKIAQERRPFGYPYSEMSNSALDLTMPDEFRLIPTEELVDSPLILREVKEGGVEYLEMRDSLATRGFLNSICVRPSPRMPGKFEVVDGRYRWTAAKEIGLLAVPCIIKFGLSDTDVLAMQIAANAVRPTTTKSEFALQIRRVLKSDAGMTMAAMVRTLHKSPTWISWMLQLTTLPVAIQHSVDRGEMTLEAAYYLNKLPTQLRDQFVDEARVLSLPEFKAMVLGALSQYRIAVKQGRLERFYEGFSPRPWLRTFREIREEHENPKAGPMRIVITNCKTALEGWRLAFEWILHLDPDSLERTKRRYLRKLKPAILRKQENSHDVKSVTDDTEVT